MNMFLHFLLAGNASLNSFKCKIKQCNEVGKSLTVILYSRKIFFCKKLLEKSIKVIAINTRMLVHFTWKSFSLALCSDKLQ